MMALLSKTAAIKNDRDDLNAGLYFSAAAKISAVTAPLAASLGKTLGTFADFIVFRWEPGFQAWPSRA